MPGTAARRHFAFSYSLHKAKILERAIEQERTYGFDPDNKHKRQAEFLRAFAARMREGAIEIPELKRSSTEK